MKIARSQQLLAEYVETGSEAAFRTLVQCYIGLVFSAARRLVGGDIHRAEDVTQIVFCDLARKARALSRESMLGGWLHRHTCYVASRLMRSDRRRQAREKTAMEMNNLHRSPDSNVAQLAPILDESINELQAPERELILQRFFEQQNFRSLGEALGITEDAARMRLNRAVEKLHGLLGARGFTLSATALAAVLASEALTAAPASLVPVITTAAIAGLSATSGITSGILKAMSLTKANLAITGAFVAALMAVTVMLQHHSQAKMLRENHLLRQQLASAETSLQENQRLSNLVSELSAQVDQHNDRLSELLKLRGEVARLRSDSQALAKLRQLQVPPSQLEQTAPTTRMPALYTRMIKVNPALLLSPYSNTIGSATDTESSYQVALQQFLSDHDIAIEPPAAIYMNVTNGTLFVRSSLQDLDKLERLITEIPQPASKSEP